MFVGRPPTRHIAPLLALIAVASCDSPPTSPLTGPAGSEARAEGPAPLYAMNHPNRIPDRYIVRFNSRVSDSRGLSNQLARQANGRVYHAFQGLKGFWGEIPEAAIDGLRRNPNVAYIEADVEVKPAGGTIQNNPRWPLDRVDQRNLPLNLQFEYDPAVVGDGVHVWIIDSGVDRNESELSGRVGENMWVTLNGQDPYGPCNTHGTRVARVAAGSTVGIARGAVVHAARVDENCGSWSTGAASYAFEVIADYSPRPAVINYSGGHGCWWIFCGNTVDDAAKYAKNHGVTVVVSAGNDDDDACDFSPAHTQELITVGASNRYDQRISIPGWWGSNWGGCVDVFAPVEDDGGTSLAAPMVTGTAARILQANPSFSPDQVANTIVSQSTKNVLANIGQGSPNRLLFAPPPPPLWASVNGSIGQPGEGGASAYFYANVIGGTAPYGYYWTWDGGESTSSSISFMLDHSQVVSVRVTDAVGAQYTAYAFLDWCMITNDPNDPQCEGDDPGDDCGGCSVLLKGPRGRLTLTPPAPPRREAAGAPAVKALQPAKAPAPFTSEGSKALRAAGPLTRSRSKSK